MKIPIQQLMVVPLYSMFRCWAESYSIRFRAASIDYATVSEAETTITYSKSYCIDVFPPKRDRCRIATFVSGTFFPGNWRTMYLGAMASTKFWYRTAVYKDTGMYI